MHKQVSGFTLTEFFIVVFIIGIMAAIAIPNYCDYSIRAKVSEAVAIAYGLKAEITQAFVKDGVAGIKRYAAEVAAGLNNIVTTKVTNVTVGTTPTTMGFITVELGGITELGSDNILVFSPHLGRKLLADNNNKFNVAKDNTPYLNWVCAGKDGIKARTEFPAAGRGSIIGSGKFLPNECR